MADTLTPQQLQAVQLTGSNLLVSAAAGSGKTKVLVERLLRQLTDPVNPSNLDEYLIITYTKAAASELRGKIAARLGEAIAADPQNRHLQKQMQRLFLTSISTVHGFCTELLREHAFRLDLAADFRVAEELESQQLQQQVLDALLEQVYTQGDPDFLTFADTQGMGRDDRKVSEIVLKVYLAARNHLDTDGWLSRCEESAAVSEVTDAARTVWGSFLADRLRECLRRQIQTLTACRVLAAQTEGFEGAEKNLASVLAQLQALSQCTDWDAVLQRKDIDYGRLSFPRKTDHADTADRIRACRDACKEALGKQLRSFADPSEIVLQDLEQSGAAVRGLVALVRQFAREYESAKRSRHILDFGDLEHKTLDLLLGKHRSGPTAVASEVAARFREVLVDEYQDSNAVQDAIFRTLTDARGNCFMVGDVKQSIYQFRLADPGIFLEKYHAYAPAEAQNASGRRILLNANFRSGGEIISAVNEVFADCMSESVGGLDYGEAEALREGVPHIPLPDPGVELYGVAVREDTYREEAAFVAQRVQQLLDGSHMVRQGQELRPIRPEDIVILLRSMKSVAPHYQQALEGCGIRCQSGSGTNLLQTPEVSALRAVLQTVANPRQDIPLLAALASPVFGFTADELAAIRAGQKKGSIYDALCADENPKAQSFRQNLQQLRQTARMTTVTQLMQEILHKTRMDSVFGAMDGGDIRIANLHSFFCLAADYESGGHRELSDFLEYLETLECKGLATANDASAVGAVTIMSIHKSKGLEFPVVILPTLARQFNRDSLRQTVLCDRDLGLGLLGVDAAKRISYPTIAKRAILAKLESESLSEELRVLYVAMTRAKDRLIMTYASNRLESDLRELALQMDISPAVQLTAGVRCPGDWILYSALRRMDAGAFHQFDSRPDQLRISDMPWLIRIVEAPQQELTAAHTVQMQRQLPVGAEQELAQALAFRYAHTPATHAPSKQTATQRKGRIKDQEVQEHALPPRKAFHSWRSPSFAGSPMQGKDYGNAVHGFMQHVDYTACIDLAGVQQEAQRLLQQGFLTAQQVEALDCERIFQFFATEPGQKLVRGAEHLREFKFSILDDGSLYGQGLEQEQVLLQGVVDCALLESELTVIDFKTDYVTAETVQQIVERYRPQVQTYAHALHRIYGRPVAASYLYLFHLGILVPV